MATEKSKLTESTDPEQGLGDEDQAVDKTPAKKSFIEDLKLAKQQSSSSFQFAKTFFKIIFASVYWTILVGILNLIPLTALVIGAVYIKDCKIQPNIPVYLIVYGLSMLFRYFWSVCILSYFSKTKSDEINENDKDTKPFCSFITSLLDLFLIVWFIIGNVWIYGNFSDVQYLDKTSNSYCHGVLYSFAFWHTTLHYIILGLMMFCCPCIICYRFCFNAEPN